MLWIVCSEMLGCIRRNPIGLVTRLMPQNTRTLAAKRTTMLKRSLRMT
jgi:hypothetical protein